MTARATIVCPKWLEMAMWHEGQRRCFWAKVVILMEGRIGFGTPRLLFLVDHGTKWANKGAAMATMSNFDPKVLIFGSKNQFFVWKP